MSIDERDRKPESATVWKDTQHERLPPRLDVDESDEPDEERPEEQA